ncbi:TetR/AcrR family transcriptional regulator C-terminal domain-containing protein [Streptomyces hygroscopicus]|uniref:TetR/AcrR family transcriptional regulator C-terminal domain-containing protein n=1 Tax=Streptomyces hygroscopicus TaxID=1912 RepID=UPI00363B7D66
MLADVDLHSRLDGDPRARLEAICTSYLHVLLRHDGLARLAAGVLPYGKNAIALMTDTVLGCLPATGLPPTCRLGLRRADAPRHRHRRRIGPAAQPARPRRPRPKRP